MRRFSLHPVRRGRFIIRTVRVAVPNLAPAFRNFRIAHLTDFHFGPATPKEHIESAVLLTNSLAPDLIVLTGDYIQNTRLGVDHRLATEVNPKLFGWMSYRRRVRALAEQLSGVLGALDAPHGIIGVFGNHDYLEGIGSIRRQLPPEIDWLVNRAAYIRKEGSALLVAGVDDFNRGRPDLAATVASAVEVGRGYTPPFFKILLSHNPDIITDTSQNLLREFDLVLCGHTHGGQIRIPLLGAPITRTRQRRHVSLLSSFGSTQFYVNHGIGYGTLRLRLWCPPEIAVIELVEG